MIRDFAGPYYVSEDDMAFGTPTRYLQLNPMRVQRGDWDRAVSINDIHCCRIFVHLVGAKMRN